MEYDIAWTDEQNTAVLLQMDGAWEIEDLTDAERDIHNLLSDVGHGVDVVVSVTNPRPLSMEVVRNLGHFIRLEHPNRRRMVIVAPDDYRMGMEQIVRRLFQNNIPPHLHFAESIESAEELIAA